MNNFASDGPDHEVAQLILESIPNPVIMINNESTVLYINRSMEVFLKADRDAILGKSLVEALYKGQTQNRRVGFRSPLLETILTGREFTYQPVEIKTIYNLVPRSMLVSTFLIKEGKGKIKGACAFFYDNVHDWKHIRPTVAPSSHLETVYAFAEAIGARDCYTMGHSEKVAEYSRLIAERMGMDQQTVDLAYMCGVVHDVGKIGIPEEILNKKSPLSSEEYKLIMGHSIMGASILSHISWLEDIIPVIEAHHEKFNGTGYPRGLKGDEIPLLSRILAVSDAFDAMTSDRSYRKAFPLEKALDELVRNAGIQFDPTIVDIFIEMLKEYAQ
ncbi:MAG: PAS/PAC sensor protein [Peptococcaceae bacterium BRH_c4a]|nr:MAG: PAS/PAC sensor protein [Peptococcaceae bacterium BRH_c4a]